MYGIPSPSSKDVNIMCVHLVPHTNDSNYFGKVIFPSWIW